MRKNCADLEKTSQGLETALNKNEELLEKTGQELGRVKSDYEKIQNLLCEKVAELGQVRAEMGKEVEKARLIGKTLNEAMTTMSNTILSESTQREAFQEKLDTFLASKESSFAQITTGLSETEKELAKVKDELKEANQRNQELLDRQELLVKRMEEVASQYNVENMSPKMNTTGLRNHGIYAKPVLKTVVVENVSGNVITV